MLDSKTGHNICHVCSNSVKEIIYSFILVLPCFVHERAVLVLKKLRIAAYIWIMLDQDGKKLLFFQIDAKIKSELHADALGFLQNYLQAAGVALN